jgi:hypothetical protein
VNVSFASAKGSGSHNEDWVGATSSVAVVLDGITSPPGMEDTGCSHGTPWVVASIGSRLIALTEEHPTLELSDLLAQAIAATAARHADTCDLDNKATPSAAVAMVRQTDKGLDYLVLSDAAVVIDAGDDVWAVIDVRGQTVIENERAAVFAHPIGTAEHASARQAMVTKQRSYRNSPDGYWVAAGKPEAASHAVAGHVDGTELRRAAVLSDGAAALVDYGLTDWKGLLNALEEDGPENLIGRVREAERSDTRGTQWPRFKPNDDATAVLCTFDK